MKQFQKKENINVLSLRAILQKNDKERNLCEKNPTIVQPRIGQLRPLWDSRIIHTSHTMTLF